MSAERLREAAALMRSDWGVAADIRPDLARMDPHWRRGLAWLAAADWLDTAGADLWAHGPMCACDDGCDDCDDQLWAPHVRDALAVANAYLGGAQ